jgi:hypothetical protein
MGDMEITDYMCRTLAQERKLVSPTKFHNSVHNAPAGYWSIATGAFSPATAVSAFEYSAPMAFLEAAIQCVEERTPVVLVTQEIAAPFTIMDICPSEIPFAAAFLLAPVDLAPSPLCKLDFQLKHVPAAWPEPDPRLRAFRSNMSACLLPLMAAIADRRPVDLCLPVSTDLSLTLSQA